MVVVVVRGFDRSLGGFRYHCGVPKLTARISIIIIIMWWAHRNHPPNGQRKRERESGWHGTRRTPTNADERLIQTNAAVDSGSYDMAINDGDKLDRISRNFHYIHRQAVGKYEYGQQPIYDNFFLLFGVGAMTSSAMGCRYGISLKAIQWIKDDGYFQLN